MSRGSTMTCARSCVSLARLTYPLPAFSKVTSTRCRSWPGTAITIKCRRSRSEWQRAACRPCGVRTMPKAFTLSMAESFVLQGRKILASGAGFVTDPIVTAKADDGQVMCLLQLTMDEKIDLSAWNAQGMRSTATGTIDLSGIVVTSENMVGVAGDFMRQPYFSGGAWRFCAAHVGATERLVDLFRDHLVARSRGEDPYQLQRLAQCIASAKTARFWVEEAARRLSVEEPDAGNVVAFANLDPHGH